MVSGRREVEPQRYIPSDDRLPVELMTFLRDKFAKVSLVSNPNNPEKRILIPDDPHLVMFKPGEDIVVQGGEDQKLWIAISEDGEYEVVKVDEDGTETVQARLRGPGNVIGEIRVLNPEVRRTRTVRAVTEFYALEFDAQEVAEWNGRDYPYGQIYGFLADLAMRRFDAMRGEDLKIAGADWRAEWRAMNKETPKM